MNVTEILGAPVADASDAQQPWHSSCSSRQEPAAPAPQPVRSRRVWLVIALVLVALLGGLGGWMMARTSVEPATGAATPKPEAMPANVAATAVMPQSIPHIAANEHSRFVK